MIHTVGPVWYGGTRGEAALLASCYQNSLELARQHGIRSIAFPSVSTGVYGYPVKLAAQTAVAAVMGYLQTNPDAFARIKWVLHDARTMEAYQIALENAQ